jgi:hypothetical protein
MGAMGSENSVGRLQILRYANSYGLLPYAKMTWCRHLANGNHVADLLFGTANQ